MRIYYCDDTVIAMHSENNAPNASVYGNSVRTMDVEDDIILERIGPDLGTDIDLRPYKVPTIKLTDLKKQAKNSVITIINNFSNNLTSKYPQSEMLSWSTKDTAARLYQAGEKLDDYQLLLLNTEKDAGNYKDLDELCETIVTNSNMFIKIAGSIAGFRASSITDIDKAKSLEEMHVALTELQSKLNSL